MVIKTLYMTEIVGHPIYALIVAINCTEKELHNFIITDFLLIFPSTLTHKLSYGIKAICHH